MINRNLFILICIFVSSIASAQVAVKEDGSDPHSSAVLDVQSTSKGILIPRMTTTQRDAISSPVDGLTIINTTDSCEQIYWDSNWYSSWCFNCQPTITSQPNDSTICYQDNATFSVSANGSNLSYQWEVSTDAGTTFTKLTATSVYSGVTTTTLSLTSPATSYDGYQYRCVVSGDCTPNATSDVVTLTVTPHVAITSEPVSINTEPIPSTYLQYSVTATNATAYQWQSSQNGGVSWIDMGEGGGAANVTTNTVSVSVSTDFFDGYKIRCKVTGCDGDIYSREVWLYIKDCPSTVTDYNSNSYNVVSLAGKCWMSQSLKVTNYSDGTAISLVTADATWNSQAITKKAYCYYSNNSANGDDYGALYTWAAAMNGGSSSNSNPSGRQGVCPSGWHLPSAAEYDQLVAALDGGDLAGGACKETGTTYWKTPNTGATNSSGFSMRGGGRRANSGAFFNLKDWGHLWTATSLTGTYADYGGAAWLTYHTASWNTGSGYHKKTGLNVRCIED